MNGLRFELLSPVVESSPLRTDIACFAGFVRRRATSVPEPIERWLGDRRYPSGDLLNVPVPIDTWNHFDHLFEWEHRTSSADAGTYMGAAVRSYFAQGGRKCYIVRAGDPWPLNATLAERLTALAQVFPGYQRSLPSLPGDRDSWRGIAHLFGLSDVSFLCVPDLGDAVQSGRRLPVLTVPATPPPEQFVECAPDLSPPRQQGFLEVPAPRSDSDGFAAWAEIVLLAAETLSRFRRDVQFIAAVPMPHPDLAEAANLLDYLAELGFSAPSTPGLTKPASAFVQLAYPWLRTPGSNRLPEGVESPDAVLAGVLARNALSRGAFRSAAGSHLADVYETVPALGRGQMFGRGARVHRSIARDLAGKVSLFGPTPSGLRLLSDVTTSEQQSYRQACINRIVSILVRAARDLGEQHTFENSGEQLWGLLAERVRRLLEALRVEGALNGATPAEAYDVACDRTVMTQNDLDNGRVIVRVRFQPSFPIDSISVLLALNEGGLATVVQPPAQEAAA